MSDETNHPSQTPEPERGGHADASNGPTPQARTRTMMLIGIGIVCFFLLLLAIGVIPRLRNDQALTMAAQKAQNNVPQVYVIRPEPASEADLTLAATTQAIQDSIIYARTSGYLRKRYVDIGDRVTAGQLLAEIESPEVYQQLQQAHADLQQAEKNLDLQKANLDLARTTLARYEAADAEEAVAKQAVDQSVSAHRTAQASVAATEANVKSNKANVQRLQDLTSFQRVLAEPGEPCAATAGASRRSWYDHAFAGQLHRCRCRSGECGLINPDASLEPLVMTVDQRKHNE